MHHLCGGLAILVQLLPTPPVFLLELKQDLYRGADVVYDESRVSKISERFPLLPKLAFTHLAKL
jgi:hypothetical protein